MPVDEVREALERTVPDYGGRSGDWEGVVAEAQRRAPPPRAWNRWAAAAVAAAAALVLFWPLHGDGDRVLERARAAVQGGPVVHVVLRAASTDVYDLERNEYRRIPGVREQWYDPDRGLHEVRRIGSRVVDDVLYPAGPPEVERQFTGLATAYRRALAGDDASLGDAETVEGRGVRWIRFRVRYPEVGIPTYDAEHEVAVDVETFEPRFLRVAGGPIATVLSFETLPGGRGDFTAARTEEGGGSEFWYGISRVGPRTSAEAREVLRGALWLGDMFGDLPLGGIREVRYETGRTGPPFKSLPGLDVCYGSGDPCPVLVSQTTEPHPMAGHGHGWHTTPPPGTLAFADRPGLGYVIRDGLYVTIRAGSRDELVAAAEALRPIP